MSEEQINVIRQLRNEGYAIAIFTPEEIGEASESTIEDAMVEVGWEVIERYQNE